MNQLNFTKRNKYPWNIFVDKETFITFTEYLKLAGFKDIVIKIPLDEETSERGGKEPIPLSKFLKTDRNYKALILIASNSDKELRVLFKNTGDTNFLDDIFPSAGSNTTYNFYISSKVLSDVYSLNHFIQDFFIEYKVFSFVGTFIITFLLIVPVYLLFYFLFDSTTSQTLVSITIFLLITLVVTVLRLPSTGLYFHNPSEARVFSESINKLKEQWLVILVASLLSFAFGLMGNFLRTKFGW